MTTPDTSSVLDALARPLQDLRISLTDRCNFRCVYCMPSEIFGKDHAFLPRSELLSFEEITRLVRLVRPLGVRKVRLTGGEPLLRRDVPLLVEMLAALGLDDLAMTSNGALLARYATALARAGLKRVTVSLDSMDNAVFQRINGISFPVEQVLEGIDAAAAAGLAPIKINMVVQRGLNEDQILPMARHFHGSGHSLRFIEYMDVGASNGWKLDRVLPAARILEVLRREFELEELEPGYRGEVASRVRHTDGGGELGIISSVSKPFCRDCTRMRLSAEGKVHTCLFATTGTDLRPLLRGSASDEQLQQMIAALWNNRSDRYSELRDEDTPRDGRVEMSYIGG
ncbi:MAG: GTP 3',8-cyclase MoaA [Candidatus Cloacimonetes bacterium]|nr:GTP 3',8-cyclase MoaA [Candidatus Cloacimonadota bacterium]